MVKYIGLFPGTIGVLRAFVVQSGAEEASGTC